MQVHASSAASPGVQGLGAQCFWAVGSGALCPGPVGVVGWVAAVPQGQVHAVPRALGVSTGPSTTRGVPHIAGHGKGRRCQGGCCRRIPQTAAEISFFTFSF